MRNTLLSILLIVIVGNVIAQTKTSYEVGLVNGDTLKPTELKIKSPSFGKRHILVDGQRYEIEEVKYYVAGEDYYITANPDGYGLNFYLRELDGDKVKTYSLKQTYYSGGASGQYGGSFHTQKVGYYQLKNRPMKDLNYQQLRMDLRDNIQSMNKLNEIKKLNTIGALITTVGVGMLIGGIVATSNSADEDASNPPSERDASLSPFIFVGAITISIPFFFRGAKYNKMNEALMLYNQ